jgi:histidine triad (HIT) family protein
MLIIPPKRECGCDESHILYHFLEDFVKGMVSTQIRKYSIIMICCNRQRNNPDLHCTGGDMSTIFSKIIDGEIPADIVYKDDEVTAFRDIEPQAPIHILIVPNKEIPTVNDIHIEDEKLVGHMFTVAQQIALREGIAEDGYRLLINTNKNAGQEVFHLHMHLFAGRPLGPMLLRKK